MCILHAYLQCVGEAARRGVSADNRHGYLNNTRQPRRMHCTLLGLVAAVGLCSQLATAQSSLPLEPTRTIRFTTDEGTWMSVDVSPDGRTIVFDMVGDLYTLPITGGKATAITRGLGFDMQPRWSPDGKQIVFISDRDGD